MQAETEFCAKKGITTGEGDNNEKIMDGYPDRKTERAETREIQDSALIGIADRFDDQFLESVPDVWCGARPTRRITEHGSPQPADPWDRP